MSKAEFINVENLRVKKGDLTIIERVSFIGSKGSVTAIIGKNGAGKTTLIRCLLNDIRHEGLVYFTDKNGNITKKVRYGYVPQKLDFDKSAPFTVADYITASRSLRPVFSGISFSSQNKIKEILHRTGMANLVSRRLGDLSGGELQKLLLSLAIDPLPDILILDEPDTGIDKASIEDFYKLIYSIAKADHVAVIMVSHDFEMLMNFSDTIILMDGKTIIAQKSPKALFKSAEFLQIYGKQDIM